MLPKRRELQMIPFDRFEKMPGGLPYRLLASHPDGRHVAMQASEHDAGRSAVWEQETGHIVWKPERAIALAWLRHGTQIAVLREANTAPYEFVLYSWPEAQLLHACPLMPPPACGWMLDLVISPQNDLALCYWVDQSEAGFEFVDITPQGVSYDAHASYLLEGTNSEWYGSFP